MKFSIRDKITAPYVILALGIAIGGAFIITRVLLGSIEERFNNQVIETAKLTAEAFSREEELLLETLRVVVNTEGVAQAAANGDPGQLRKLILPVVFNSQDELLSVLDSDGTGILTIKRPENGVFDDYIFTQGDRQYQNLLMVQNVLDRVSDQSGDKFAGYHPFAPDSYFLISAPLEDSRGNLVGVVVIGKRTSTLVRQFREATFAQITLYDFEGEVIDSTLFAMPSVTQDNIETVISNKDSQVTIREAFVEDIDYREMLFSWQARDNQDLGVVGSALATSFLAQADNLTRFNVFILTVLTLATVIIVGVYVANFITRPLIRLQNAASEISAGDLSIQVDPKGGDEIASLTVAFNDMVTNLRTSQNALIEAYDRTIEGWAKALELRDEDTEGHSQRVTEMTIDLAQKFGYSGAELEYIRRGALLHDIGKMGVPDDILRKPAKLTKKEWEIMKKHPEMGKELIEQIEFLHPAMDIPFYHHEKWDGSGYPQGLKGEDIPQVARIFAVIDVWDAIRYDRSYRAAMSTEKALQVINDGRGSHFDPEVVDVFLNYLSNTMTDNNGKVSVSLRLQKRPETLHR